jgi:hypothetical protein
MEKTLNDIDELPDYQLLKQEIDTQAIKLTPPQKAETVSNENYEILSQKDTIIFKKDSKSNKIDQQILLKNQFFLPPQKKLNTQDLKNLIEKNKTIFTADKLNIIFNSETSANQLLEQFKLIAPELFNSRPLKINISNIDDKIVYKIRLTETQYNYIMYSSVAFVELFRKKQKEQSLENNTISL